MFQLVFSLISQLRFCKFLFRARKVIDVPTIAYLYLCPLVFRYPVGFCYFGVRSWNWILLENLLFLKTFFASNFLLLRTSTEA